MGSYRIDNGVVDLGKITLPVPDSVSPTTQAFLSANPWGDVPDSDEHFPMWETREATAAAFQMLDQFALSIWPCEIEDTSIAGVHCHRVRKPGGHGDARQDHDQSARRRLCHRLRRAR